MLRTVLKKERYLLQLISNIKKMKNVKLYKFKYSS